MFKRGVDQRDNPALTKRRGKKLENGSKMSERDCNV